MEELVKYLELDGLLQNRNIRRAFLKIDRADFVSERMLTLAYSDRPLSIGKGQTISQPTTVAFMLELLNPKPGNRILDVGTGSGWQAALLAEIVGKAGKVFTVEIVSSLYQQAQRNLAKYKFTNINFFCQDARSGLPEHAPFDGIIAGASGEEVLSAWKKQLKIGGRIVAPVGTSVMRYTKQKNGKFEIEEYPGFLFVPLVN